MKSLAAVLLSCAAAFAQMPSDAEIRRILMERVGSETAGFGIVVGVIDANGRRVVAYGSLAKNDPGRLDGRTVFEIGSMTKVFTSLLLRTWCGAAKSCLPIPSPNIFPKA